MLYNLQTVVETVDGNGGSRRPFHPVFASLGPLELELDAGRRVVRHGGAGLQSLSLGRPDGR
jgi:hypothetical protein